MIVPEPPALKPLEHISPSVYEASKKCMAKAIWYACGLRGVLPENPAAIIGTSFHEVVAAAHGGMLGMANDFNRDVARQFFDEHMHTLHSQAHPLVRLKFPEPERLPFYNLQRERASLIATNIASSLLSTSVIRARKSNLTFTSNRIEYSLRSKDGLIVGRPDYIDGRSGAVVDYKSGYTNEAEAGSISDAEVRQLRLYTYLSIENGINISKGVIVRSGGRRCELPISSAEAEAAATDAREQIQRLNGAVRNGARFSVLASPSSQNCRSCPCIPFCESFWSSVAPEWSSECGSHFEGKILDVENRQLQGVSLTTLIIELRAGTGAAQCASIEQVPNSWLELEDDPPLAGDIVRVVHGRQLGADAKTAVIRIDKSQTAVWRIRRSGSNMSRQCTHRMRHG